jgi:X-Pro dipeptidyl-peptidase (S15 family)
MGRYQPWSNGKVGLNGISYFSMNAWQVAALQPPHLAAVVTLLPSGVMRPGSGRLFVTPNLHAETRKVFLV